MQFETRRDLQSSMSGAWGSGESRAFEVGQIAWRAGAVVWYSSVSVGVEVEWRQWGGVKGANRCGGGETDMEKGARKEMIKTRERREENAQKGWSNNGMDGQKRGRRDGVGRTWSQIEVWLISHLSHSLDSQERGRRPVRQSPRRSWPLYGSEQWPPGRAPAPHSWFTLIKEQNIT